MLFGLRARSLTTSMDDDRKVRPGQPNPINQLMDMVNTFPETNIAPENGKANVQALC